MKSVSNSYAVLNHFEINSNPFPSFPRLFISQRLKILSILYVRLELLG